jgi:hypothetical protein
MICFPFTAQRFVYEIARFVYGQIDERQMNDPESYDKATRLSSRANQKPGRDCGKNYCKNAPDEMLPVTDR